MKTEDKVLVLPPRAEVASKSPLEQIVTEGARRLLQAAIENEVEDYLHAFQHARTAAGRAAVVRNGHLPERQVLTGVGPIPVRQPGVRHREGGKFTSAILPKYLRRVREHRCAHSRALPQRRLDGRFQRRAGGDPGRKGQRTLGG